MKTERDKQQATRLILQQHSLFLSDILASHSSEHMSCTFVGRTPSIVSFRTRIRPNDGSEKFGGFVYVWDGFLQRNFVLWVFVCPNNITLFFDFIFASNLCLFYGYHAKGYHAPSILQGLSRLHHCTATTPLYLYPGYHATGPSSICGLSHLSDHAPPHT